jgi:hypothetical protein
MTDHTKQEQQHRETNLKARMAESLVYDLLTEAGNDVYRIGYRTLLPSTLSIEDALQSHPTIGKKLRAVPEFLVLDRKGNPHLVDVKFRWNPEGHVTDIAKLKKVGELWDEALIIFVNCSQKPYFRISHAPFISRGAIITAPVTQHAAFNIPITLVERFDTLVVKYLTPTLFPLVRER